MTGADDGAVVFVLESGTAEINQANFRVEQDSALIRLPVDGCRRGGYLSVVGECLVGAVAQKNVLRLQIRVDEVEIVQDCSMLAKDLLQSLWQTYRQRW